MLVRNLLLALGVLTLVAGLALSAVWFVQRDRSPVTEATAPRSGCSTGDIGCGAGDQHRHVAARRTI